MREGKRQWGKEKGRDGGTERGRDEGRERGQRDRGEKGRKEGREGDRKEGWCEGGMECGGDMAYNYTITVLECCSGDIDCISIATSE